MDNLATEGHKLLSLENDLTKARNDYDSWIILVRDSIATKYSNTGFVAEWLSLSKARLQTQSSSYSYSLQWDAFCQNIQSKLKWLANLPNKALLYENINKPIPVYQHKEINNSATGGINNEKTPFISPDRINELRELKSSNFELTKLIALCNELNICYQTNCWYSLSSLTRTILNYVPPIFGGNNFDSVAAQSPKSIKKVLEKLNTDAKDIADHHLHEQAMKSEAILTEQQVNFSSQLDVLLVEVIKKIKENQ